MMSTRKKRSRSADAARAPKQRPSADGESGKSPLPLHSPKRNVAMLALSIVIFLTWVLFLVYVAIFV